MSQRLRRLKALDPTHVSIDERDVQDFLVFALRFAEQLDYFGLQNRRASDWRPFFSRNSAVATAAIQKTNPLPERHKILAALEGPQTPDVLGAAIGGLLDLARKIDDWDRSLDASSGLKAQIKRLIRANLSTVLARLAAYERASSERLSGFPALEPERYRGFGSEWNLADPTAIAADPSLFGAYESTEDQIASAKAALEGLFTTLYNTFVDIIREAPAHFEAEMGRKDHAPHIALLLAFLTLYLAKPDSRSSSPRSVRDDANNLTRRHLDFYYEKVLRLATRAAEPDHAHLVVKPAKQTFHARRINEYRIPAGTPVDAGKDASGIDRIYKLDDDLIANLARIDSLRTLHLAVESAAVKKIMGLYAAPAADSGDGLGGEFENEDVPSWPTFGGKGTPEARIGFAIASRELLLLEGKRIIKLSLRFSELPGALADAALKEVFEISLSGEAEWIVVENVDVSVGDAEEVVITVTLEPSDPAITAFDAKALGANYGTTLPLIRVMLKHTTIGGAHAYDAVKHLELEKIGLEVEVDELRDVRSQNDLSLLDTTKAFQPFGPLPSVGSSFYIGSPEAFQKHLQSLTLNIQWADVPASFPEHYKGYRKEGLPSGEDFTARLSMLNPRAPADRLTMSRGLFPFEPEGEEVQEPNPEDGQSGGTVSIEIEISNEDVNLQPPLMPSDLEGYGVQDKSGFLKMSLERDFLHREYAAALARQSIAAARFPETLPGAVYDPPLDDGDTTSEPVIPKEPYTPTINDVYLGYSSSVDSAAHPEALELIHIHPFENTYEHRTTAPGPALLPQFDFEGALFIGVKDLKPRQSLSILFQVAEATANTDLEKATVEWHYLASNRWHRFEDFEVTRETTSGLITSGIITFAIPGRIDQKSTILPSELTWIRASTKQNAAAVSELIGVHAQAVRASFSDQGNDPNHLATPLPAETVSGFVADVAAVESVEQPYPSFGGRPAEKGLPFYTRVSERLRHKGRAITRFDYERLVLEQFPEIHKVKCLNHTDDKHRVAPGNVVIAVIPDFTKLKAADRHAPKVTLDKLESIKTFLREINCPFVGSPPRAPGKLYVVNPVYEEIRVSFRVKFQPTVTSATFYTRELKKAIIRFLSPWAFEDGGEISFGGTLYKSTLLNFVEERPYVDYVTDFEMMHKGSDHDVDLIDADTPRSILIPAAEDRHDVQPIEGPYCPVEHGLRPEGIGAMTVSDDFQVFETIESA